MSGPAIMATDLIVPEGGGAQPPRQAFDYSALPAELASEAKETAERIHDRGRKYGAAFIAATGRDLIDIKEKLGHGHFLAWIEAEFGMSDQTAANYMNVARRFSEQIPNGLEFELSVLYALAAPSTPDEVRDHIIGRIEQGERVPPSEIRATIKEAKEARKELRQDAKRSPGQRRYRRQVERQRKAEEEQRQARFEQERQAAQEAVEMLISALGDDLLRFTALVNQASWRFSETLRAALSGEAK